MPVVLSGLFEVLVDRLARWVCPHGGRGSGKSYTVGALVPILCLIDKWFVVLARDYKDDVEYSIWKNIIDRIRELELDEFFKITQSKITCLVTGSEIIPFGLVDNPSKIKSLEGCDLLIMEESAKTPYIVWKNVIPTIRKEGAIILPIFNPDWEQDETYQQMITNQEDLQLGYFIRLINYVDNPHCPESIKRDAEVMKEKDFEKFENIYLGKPRSTAKQQIFSGCYQVMEFNPDNFETNRNDPDYKGIPVYYYGLEWGYSQKPTAVVLCFEYDDCLWIWQCSGGIGLEIPDIPKTIRELTGAETAKIRANPNLPATLKNVRAEDRKLTLVSSETWTGEDIDKIKYLRGKYERIYIHPKCIDVIDEFERYFWEYDSKQEEVLDKPIDQHNQYIKAIGHAICRKVKSGV